MADYNFYIIPITKDGNTYTIGTKTDIEQTFKSSTAALKYKAITGLEAYGKPRPYVENYAESDMALVELPSSDVSIGKDPREQTDITLTLLFMFEGNSNTARDAQIKATADIYHNFVSAISGKYILYYDTARQRKALLYQSDKIDPKTDSLKGITYKEVDFKFKNVFGRTFPIDSISPIENALGATNNLSA